jgi:DNA repair exonuclease SbcCD ATPase subunit
MWHLTIENIAGIHEAETDVAAGVNVVQASNWQGKTSLLKSVRAVLGGTVDTSTVTEGESEGSVTLTNESTGEQYSVRLVRTPDSVMRRGEPYLTDKQDRTCADLFAFLDEQNELRRAVREGEDLTPFLLRPLEQANIEEQIESLQSKRSRLTSELERTERAAKELPKKIEQRTQLEDELENLRDELSGLEGSSTGTNKQDELREELNTARRELERAEQRRGRLTSQVESIESQIDTKEEELAEIDVPSDPELETTLESKQTELQKLEARIEPLRDLYSANKRCIDEKHYETVSEVDRGIDANRFECWVCGNETATDSVEEQLDALHETISEKRERISALRSEVTELQERREEIERHKRRQSRLEEEIPSLGDELEAKRSRLQETKTEVEEREHRIEELEEQLEDSDDRRSTLEQTIARKEAQLENVRDRIEELESEAAKRDDLNEQVEEIRDEIEALRGRREETIEEARDAFERAFEDVRERFAPSFEAARLDKKTDPETNATNRLDLVLVRDGREIPVTALSEGEVELVGFIAALAGYEAFDVAERVPCILLDDVGGLAGEHLRTLVEYLEERTEYLVTTAYPEAGDFDGTVLTPEDWDVVSDRIDRTPEPT